jgi:hypothetical protein
MEYIHIIEVFMSEFSFWVNSETLFGALSQMVLLGFKV